MSENTLEGHEEAYTLQLGMEDADRDNAGLLRDDFNASEILVQIIQRPQDPITRTLQESIAHWVAAGVAVQPLQDPFGGWIDVARNWQTRMFLKEKRFKYCMLVDTDVGAPTHAPFMLARHRLPVVSGVVCGWSVSKGGLFACFASKGPNGKAMFPTMKETKTLPASGLLEVTNCGAGLLMVRRDVIETLWDKYENEKTEDQVVMKSIRSMLKSEYEGVPSQLDKEQRDAVWKHVEQMDFEKDLSGPPFSIPETVRDKGALQGVMPKGEDICFTDRVRAAGFKIHVDLELHAYHEKAMRMAWPKEGIDPELSIEDWQLSVYDAPIVETR